MSKATCGCLYDCQISLPLIQATLLSRERTWPNANRPPIWIGTAGQNSDKDFAGSSDFLRPVAKMRQALTFLATIQSHNSDMKTLAVISILALLAISGAVYTDQVLTGDRQSAQTD